MWVAWLEIGLGVAGMAAGIFRRVKKSSSVIALGLLLVGLAHLGSGSVRGPLTDVGGMVLIFGVGMTLSELWRSRSR